ncbi:DsbA family oxidoreductase [Hydrogenophaga sp. A37]|uniref:DsbA family oxidoreductase n=1 Tax=Hydrogenophaga sp. A37 TaxID=1945864 RepID=UPI000984D9CC|nr:DsbA family oxidoreductase [Hydrogenophaga sp. A37]OOG80971.1 disulfide bond formation protein DsbA [Hydrogenophaga sp. A37]
MSTTLKIDFVSDVSCPWCAIGLSALEQALTAVQGDIQVDMHFQPFELNPQMGPEGQDVTDHLTQKYGSTAEQQAQIRATIRQRGAEAGFTFNPEGRGRIWNTFDAHRLLAWADVEGAPGQQHALKKALLTAYHGRAESPADHAVLLAACEAVGLDPARAQAVLSSDEFAAEVREREQFFTRAGISSVPAVIINQRHLISGGQPAAVFEQALRQIAAEAM